MGAGMNLRGSAEPSQPLVAAAERAAAEAGAADAAAAPAAEATGGPLLRLAAWTPGGIRHDAEVGADRTVAELKRALSGTSGTPAYQFRLLAGNELLKDSWILRNCGVADGAELTMVVGPPMPEWAIETGLGGEHPALLRGYHETHGLELSKELSDDGEVWRILEEHLESQRAKKAQLRGWGHLLQLETANRGGPAASCQACGTLRAAPGQTVDFAVTGSVWNNGGDTCIHQIVLVLDACRVLCDVYNGVPGRGKKLKQAATFEAPSEPGTYMLWSYSDLQYRMADARRNLQRGHGQQVTPGKYPKNFVGWLVVEDQPGAS